MTDQGAVDPMKYCVNFLEQPIKLAEVTSLGGLNVRIKPVDGQVLRVLKRKEVVEVMEEVNGWARLRSIRPEWCSMQYLLGTQVISVVEPSLEEKVARLWAAHPEIH